MPSPSIECQPVSYLLPTTDRKCCRSTFQLRCLLVRPGPVGRPEPGRLLPDKQNEGCQLVGVSSDETSIEQLEQGVSVRISGKYLFECEQETEQYEEIDLILFFEEHEGEWYLAGFNS